MKKKLSICSILFASVAVVIPICSCSSSDKVLNSAGDVDRYLKNHKVDCEEYTTESIGVNGYNNDTNNDASSYDCNFFCKNITLQFLTNACVYSSYQYFGQTFAKFNIDIETTSNTSTITIKSSQYEFSYHVELYEDYLVHNKPDFQSFEFKLNDFNATYNAELGSNVGFSYEDTDNGDFRYITLRHCGTDNTNNSYAVHNISFFMLSPYDWTSFSIRKS